MSMQTFFQYDFTSALPLPPCKKPGQNPGDIATYGLSVALTLLHDPEFMLNLNPIKLHHEQIDPSADPSEAIDIESLATEFNVDLPRLNHSGTNSTTNTTISNTDEWSQWRIHDSIPIIPNYYSKQIVFKAALRSTPDGCESLTDPGSSVRIYGKWEVRRSRTNPDTELELTELQTAHCNILLGWYIKGTLSKSHEEIHQMFREKFVEKVRSAMSI